jgi:hypothetical protein
LGAIMEHMAYFPSGPSLHCPCDRWNPRYLTVSWQIWAFFSGNLISCLPQKGENEVSSFHTILLSWSSKQKVIYILDKYADMLVDLESL